MSQTLVTFLVVVLGSCSVNCWIINNINIPHLKRQFIMDLADFDNDISADDFALQRFSLIYPGKESSESDSCQKC